MSRHALTLTVAGIAAAVLLAVAAVLPVPYVILGPGPTLNTLGTTRAGKPMIEISGHRVYPASGHLNMVTVSYEGGPGSDLSVYDALQAWLQPQEAVVPQRELFAPGQSQKQAQQAELAQMSGSQQVATAAALYQLGIPYKVEVAGTLKGLPAYGVLRPGDVVTAVDGTPVTSIPRLTSLITAHQAGTPVRLTISRHGTTRQVRIRTAEDHGKPAVGTYVQPAGFPFSVKINVGDIGGPSAGMMFALGIIDKLTGDNLAGGTFIAGTGTIGPDGTVGPIGGIQEKMVAARDKGATVFLAPAANCPDTVGAVPAGLRVVKVSTLAGAVHDLQALKAGKPVPSC
jgi:PDZ domain-containing protein